MHEIVHVLSSDFFQYNNKLPNNPSINIGCGHFLIYKVRVSKDVILGCGCQNAQNKCIQNPLPFGWACSRYIQFLRRLHLQESSNE